MTGVVDVAAFGELDSEDCLIVVGSYSAAAAVVGSVAREAAARIATSPALDDFVELQFVDLGPRPDHAAGHSVAVRRIARELTNPRDAADRSYFALVLADRSAEAVAQALSACRTDPIMAALPMRYRGFASVDDRRPGVAGDEPDAAVLVSPTGAWRRGELVDEVTRCAAELMREFAGWREPGLTQDEVEQLRLDDEQLATEPGTGHSSPATVDHEPGSAPAVLPLSDALEAPAEPPPPPSSLRAEPKLLPSLAAAPPLPASAMPLPESLPPVADRRRRLPVVRWLPSRAAKPVDSADAVHVTDSEQGAGAAELAAGASGAELDSAVEPVANGLVYLILSNNGGPGDGAAWRRGHSVLHEVDGKLAERSDIAIKVRFLQNAGDAATSKLRSAGQLSRREMRRRSDETDLGKLFGAALTVLKRDLAAAELAGSEVARPAVVLFAFEAPLADAVTADLYRDMIRMASVTWVVPEAAVNLISSIFTDGEQIRVLTDHQSVAEELATILSHSVKPEPTDDGNDDGDGDEDEQASR